MKLAPTLFNYSQLSICLRSFWMPDYNYHYEIPEADLEVDVLHCFASNLDASQRWVTAEVEGHRGGHQW